MIGFLIHVIVGAFKSSWNAFSTIGESNKPVTRFFFLVSECKSMVQMNKLYFFKWNLWF